MDIIREDFFHFLWQNLHFTQSGLRTTCGQSVRILHPGFRNDGDGADYRFSRIRLDGMLFCGDVELHKTTSEWYRHGHQRDSRYERVVLHVVVCDDLYRRNAIASDGHRIPTLELRSSLPASLSRLWRAWHRPVALPCSGLVSELPEYRLRTILGRWDRSYFRYRLNRMMALFPAETPLSAAWMQMLVRGVFQGLGYHKNQEPMLRMAGVFLEAHSNGSGSGLVPGREQRLQPEPAPTPPQPAPTPPQPAPTPQPDRVRSLAESLLRESGLETSRAVILKRTDWDLSSSRPANRPAVRLPQATELALRLTRHPISDWLSTPADQLWNEACKLTVYPAPGRNRSDILFHNVVIPALYLLGCWLHAGRLKRHALRLWQQQHIPLPGNVCKILDNGGFPSGNHRNRLALLHHYKYFCRERKCHKCEIMKYFVQA